MSDSFDGSDLASVKSVSIVGLYREAKRRNNMIESAMAMSPTMLTDASKLHETAERRIALLIERLAWTEEEIKDGEEELLTGLTGLQAKKVTRRPTDSRSLLSPTILLDNRSSNSPETARCVFFQGFMEEVQGIGQMFGSAFKNALSKNSKEKSTVMLQSSPNTLGWLEDLCSESKAKYTENEDVRTHLTWCLVFTMPDYEKGDVMTGWNDDVEFDNRLVPISHQTWVVVEKLRACDLIVDYDLSFDGKRVMIMAGAPYKVLVAEAHAIKIKCRMQVSPQCALDCLPLVLSVRS